MHPRQSFTVLLWSLWSVLFSITLVHHYSAIPQGKSIIFNYFQKALPHKVMEGSSYVLMDIYENLWTTPEVFLKWRQAVNSRAMKKHEKSTYQYSITHIGDKYWLYYHLGRHTSCCASSCSPSFSPLPKGCDEEEDPFPADEENKWEKKDPDFIPNIFFNLLNKIILIN